MNTPQDKKLAALMQMMQKRAVAGKKTPSSTDQNPIGQTITAVSREQALPLSFSQQRLWFIEKLNPAASSAYHISGAVTLQGALNEAALSQALNQLVARHEVLRTQFPEQGEAPVQHILPSSSGMPFERLYCADEQALLDEIARREQQPFDLQHGRLIRAALLSTPTGDPVLLLCMHHAIADGWSLGIVFQELSALYAQAAANNTEHQALPELACQYADYAVWQREWLQSAAAQKQSEFWRDTLTGAPEQLLLATDFPRPEKQSYQGGRLPVAFDAEFSAQLHQFSQRHGMTDYMVMLASWASLLSRLSGQEEVVIGSPIANRSRRETEGLIGFFANTLALRIAHPQGQSVSDYLAKVKARNIAAQANQDLPFDQVVEQLKPNRSLAYTPLFQVMFAWHDANSAQLQLGDLRTKVFEIHGEQTQAQFDLSLSLGWNNGCIEGDLRFAAALFRPDTMARYLACWRQLLNEWMANDQQAVDAVNWLSASERELVTQTFNQNQQILPVNQLIHQRFEQCVARYGQRIAVSFGESHLSYAQLNASANQLAHWLQKQGVRPDSRVAIALDRSEQLLVAILATLKAGGAYVPLDPNYPKERLEYSLQDSAPQVVITTTALIDKLGELPKEATLALLDKPQWQQESQANVDAEAMGLTTEHMAYIIYTSGSTGKPKGVMVEHHNVLRLMEATQADYQFNEQDVWTLFHSYAFDFSVWEIWGALLFGGRLVVVPHLISRAPEAFYQLLCAEKVTVLNQTPSAFRQLISAQQQFAPSDAQHALRYVIFGGEALELSALAPWYARPDNGATQLVNMYGITETTVHTTYYPLSAGDVQRTGASPIGRGLKDLRLYLLDDHQQPVPVGVTGELYVSGAGVARGYLNRAELTAERFLLDPFVNDGLTRMYKSGDLGRWLADGSIEYLGRNDDQVKIRGFRIELGEIEACVRGFGDIRDAAVVAQKTANGDQRLVAYFVGDDIELEALRDHVASLVPNYMVPAAWMALERLPLTSNGKLDRRALPAPSEGGLVRHAYQAPQGKAEQALADLWSELLHVAQVGRSDNFFELGGHSLLAVQMTHRARSLHGLEIGLSALFEHPVLSDLVNALQLDVTESTMLAQADGSDVITPRADQSRAPLSLAQQRIWFLCEMDANISAAYVIKSGVAITGQLDIAALEAALNTLYLRHDSLRTRFGSAGGVAYQEVDTQRQGFPLIITSGSAEFAPRFDLATGHLVAAQLCSLDETHHELRIAMHHIIADGWSMANFISELSALYAANVQHQTATLPELTINYGDFAAWQHSDAMQETLAQQQAYWVKQLAAYPHYLDLPTDHPRPEKQDFAGASRPVALDAALTARLNQFAREQGCTLYMVLLAAWSTVMARVAHQDEVIIGTPIAGRSSAQTEALLGMFVNTQPMCVAIDSAITTQQLLAQVKATALDAQEHQDLPFERMVEAVAPERNPAHSPIYQVMFALQNMPQASAMLKGLTLEVLDEPVTTAQCDLSLLVSEEQGELRGQLNYATALFAPVRVERLIGYWKTVLQGMLAAPQSPITALPMLGSVEREQVLYQYNQTSHEFGRAISIAQRFENVANRYPDAIALVEDETRLTYQTLNVLANQLAHRLLQRGIHSGDTVAVCMERSIELVIAELAIVKCGAVYVPMDINAPLDRQQFIVSDSRARLLLVAEQPAHKTQPLPSTEFAIDHLVVSRQLSAQSAGNFANVATAISGDAPAYIMHTSGSTGQPKGVVVPHRAISRLVLNNGYLEFSSYDRVALAANPAFDATTMEIWGPLLNGAAIVVINKERLLNPDALADHLVEQGVSVLWLTVGLFNQYASALGKAFTQLRYLMVGGDVLDPHTIRDVLTQHAPKHLLNGYGPTETTTFALTHEITQVTDVNRSIPLGKPIGNTQVYLLDEHQNPVPMGSVGEIVIAGEGVALEYLGQPELTKQRFLVNPFSQQPGARMYRSGDLGRRLADGTIEFLGRNDFQVKIRGYRIELGEIEAALHALPEIDDAIVIAQGESAANKRLIAYFTKTPHQALTSNQLKVALQQHLPAYMVPSAFVELSQLPLTANGKVDRKALPEPDDSALAHHEYQAPKGALEQQLATIWCELLATPQVGRDDHFFELGGHSLLAVQLISRVKTQTAIPLTIADLFDHPTLKALATRMALIKLSAFKQKDLASAAQKLFKGKING